MTIRPMTPDDVERIHQLGSACEEFDVSKQAATFWSKEALHRWCCSRTDVTLIAIEGGEIVGFALFACHRATGKATWENLFVLPANRRQGVGSRLIEAALTQLKRRGYFIVVTLTENSNNKIQAAMRAFGFNQQKQFVWYDRTL